MKVERVVVDTNVLIGAALRPQSPPRAAIEVIRIKLGALLFAKETFDELRTRLERPKFNRYVSLRSRELFLAQLDSVTEWVSITGRRLGCRDPDDDKILETALAGAADCIITGDHDLLVMAPFRGIPILDPRRFVDCFNRGNTPT